MDKRRNSCIHCNYSYCIKAGKTSQNKKRYQCKKCRKKFIGNYSYNAYHKSSNHNIQQLIKEGVGINGAQYKQNDYSKKDSKNIFEYS